MPKKSNTKDNQYEKGINYLSRLCAEVIDKNYPLKARYPHNLMIEVTNACNLRCLMCYNRKMKRKKGYMKLQTYKKVLDQAKEINIEMIGLYTTGESFLHPKIFDFIKMAKNKGFKYVYITTNGILLDKEKIEKIFASGLDSIKFSIDAASKKSYEQLKPGASFDCLYKNIKLLREMRDRKKSKLKIYASFVLTNKNYRELKNFRSFWKNIIDEVLISVVGNQSNLQKKEFNNLIPKNIKKKMIAKKRYCNLLWNRIVVTYDGKLTICPEDFEAELIYGDIHKQTLKKAWNNQRMKQFRKMFKTENFKLSPRCNRCNSDIDQTAIWKEL